MRHILGLRSENVSESHYRSAMGFSVCCILAGVLIMSKGCSEPAVASNTHSDTHNVIVVHRAKDKVLHSKEKINYERFAQAVYLSEGGEKAVVPYGILSVRCSTKAECKTICIRTVKRRFQDFKKLNGKGIESFIRFLSKSYVAGDTRASQEAWSQNVIYFYLGKEPI